MPDGDTLPRDVCADCGTIHYQNPKIVVGCLPEWEDRILLCRRAIEPRHGLWTLPAGFLENGETLADGAAARDARGGATRGSSIGELYTVISLPQINQVYMMFRARLARSALWPGSRRASTCDCSTKRDIPWESLAFRTIARTLRNFFLDRRLGAFAMHVERHRTAARAHAGPARGRLKENRDPCRDAPS